MDDDLGIDDPSNIAGMSFLINTNGASAGFDPSELEAQIIGGPKGKMVKGKSTAQTLEAEIDKITQGFGAPVKDFRYVEPSSTRPFEAPSAIDDLLRNLDNDDFNFDTPDDMKNSGRNAMPQPQNFGPAAIRQQSRNPYEGYSDPFSDPKLQYMTNEEKRQGVINDVFGEIEEEQGSNPIFSIEKEKEEDEKARKLEQICFLRETLEDESEDLSRIPNVTHINSVSEIDAVLKLLTLKNDRKRCCSFAEECILLGAHGIEWAFDGKKNYFGYKPDMVDWHKSVQSKLRRMRHDTSNVVGGIMQQYNLGSGTRILLELIPSMFLYSRMRKSQHRDNITEDEFNAGLNNLRDYEAQTKPL